MTRSPFRLATLVAVGALALMTVGPVAAQTAGTADAPRIVPLSIGAGVIDPAAVEVLAGETITFQATNVSDTEVELIVGLKADVDADSGDSLKEAENIAPGATAEVTYTFDSAGPWGYGDQIGDHYAAGAKGDVVIVDALTPAVRVIPLSIGAGVIDPATVEVVAGETVTFQATNVSDTEVELIVGLKADVDADSGDSLKEAEGIAAGATAEVTYTFDSEGPWGFGDQIGDHYAAGAKGDIVIVDALTPAASPAASPAPSAAPAG